MDEIMDTKVVQMKFDNSQFRAGVADTIKQLDMLENSLELKGASDGLNKVARASKETTSAMDNMTGSVNEVKIAFDYLEIAGITAMVRLTNAALTYGKRIANNLWSKTMGQIVSGGKRRSQNIANAKFQLEGLGVAWDQIKEDIEYGVQDTAYGLDEAATAASQLVASQVQLGNEMKTALRGISGVAAMTNSSFSEISNIWTTVASNGKLMTMQLRQLSARGLNASAVLAKAMGTTEAAINEMVTKGQIDFRTFADAMDDAFGEHAKEANKTFQGALSNMNSALSRIGAKFADPVFENLRIIFNALRLDINAVNNALSPIVEVFTTIVNQIGSAANGLLSNEHFMKGLIALALDLYSYLRPVISAIYEMLPVAIGLDGPAKAFEEFATSLQLYGDKAENVKDVIKDVISAVDILFHTVKNLIGMLRPVGEALLRGLGVPLEKIHNSTGWLYENKEAVKALIDVWTDWISLKISDVVSAVGQAIKSINWKNVLQAFVILVNVVSKAILLLPSLINVIKNIFGVLIGFIFIAGRAVTEFIDLIVRGWNALVALISGAAMFLSGTPLVMNAEVEMTGVEETVETANAAMDTVKNAAEEATDSVETLNESVDEIPERLDVAGKNAQRSSNEFAKSFEATAKSAEDSADRVEEASLRMANPSKSSVRPGGLFPTDHPEQDQRTSPQVDPNDKELENVDPHKTNLRSGEESPLIHATLGEAMRGRDTLVRLLGRQIREIEDDESGKAAIISAVDIWFGGIKDTLYEYGSKWIPVITLVTQVAIPIIAVVGIIAAAISTGVKMAKGAKALVNLAFSAIQGIADSFKALGSILKSIRKYAVAAELNAVANVIRSIAPAILSIALAIAVVVAAIYVIDKFNLQDTAQKVIDLIGQVMVWVVAVMGIVAVMSIFKSLVARTRELTKIVTVISNTLNGATKPIFKAKSTFEGVVKALATLFFSLALDLAILAVSIKMLGEMDKGDLLKGVAALMAISGIIVLMGVGLSVVSSAFKEYSYNYEQLNGAISRKGFGRERGVEQTGNSMYKMLLSLAGLMAVMAASVSLFGSMDIYELHQGMASVILSIVAIGVFMKLMVSMTTSMNIAKDGKRVNKVVERGAVDNATLKNISKFISSIAMFMLTIAAVIKSSEGLTPGQLGTVAGVVAASLGAVTAIMSVVAWNARQATTVDPKIVSKAYIGMMGIIFSLSTFLVSLGAYMRIINGIEPGVLWNGFAVMIASVAALGGAILLIVAALKKFSLTSELVVLSSSMMSMTISFSILLGAIAIVFQLLDDVDWNAMSGSAGYLIGIGIFVGAMMALVLLLSKLNKGNTGTILASSAGVFLGLTALLFGVSKTIEVISAVDWKALDAAKPFLLGLGIFITLMAVVATVLAALGPEVGLIGVAVIGSLTAMFGSLGFLFIAIGEAASLIGDGAEKIASAIEVIFNIPWSETNTVLSGLALLIGGLTTVVSAIDLKAMAGALMFAGFAALMVYAVDTLSRMDMSTIKNLGSTISAVFSEISGALSGNEVVIGIASLLILLLPVFAATITQAAVILSIGGLALITFAAEMVVFGFLMGAAADLFAPAMQQFADALTDSGSIITQNATGILSGFAELFAVGVLATVVGAFLLAGGVLMSAAGGMMYVAGLAIGAGVALLVKSLTEAGETIFGSIQYIMTGFASLIVMAVSLTIFGGLMIVAGASLIAGGIMFTIGSTSILAGSVIFDKATQFVASGFARLSSVVSASVMQLAITIDFLQTLVGRSSGLSEQFAESGAMCAAGFAAGVEQSSPSVISGMAGLAAGLLSAFNLVLGIHSPATEFIMSAGNCILGFIQGLNNGAPSLLEGVKELGGKIYDVFNGEAVEPMEGSGETSVANFIGGFESYLRDILPDFGDMLESGGNYWGDALGTGFYNGAMAKVNSLIIAMDNALAGHGYSDWTGDQIAEFTRQQQRTGHDQYHLNTAEVQQARYYTAEANNAYLHSDEWQTLRRQALGFDFLDPNDYYSGNGGGGGVDTDFSPVTSDMASAISGSSGSGSGINDASKGSAIGTGGSTVTNNNNTYNFVQNNYSPEPLQRSAIYQQTKQQFDGFYTYVKEKNLSY